MGINAYNVTKFELEYGKTTYPIGLVHRAIYKTAHFNSLKCNPPIVDIKIDLKNI